MTVEQGTQSGEKLAADLFGGKPAVREAIFRALRDAINREGVSTTQLSAFTGYNPKEIDEAFAHPREKLTGDLALSLMAPLGVAVDEALTFKGSLDLADREFWEAEFCNGHPETPDGVLAQEGAGTTAPAFEIEFGLFLRFRAFDEIN